MKKLLLIPIILILNIIIVNAIETSVTKSGYSITTPKETFFCEPIYKGNSCLIKAKITLNNVNLLDVSVDYKMEASKDIEFRQYYDSSSSIATDTNIGSVFNTINKKQLRKSSSNEINFEFWASESGKFNFSIIYGGVELKLDPFFNVTIDPSAPSLHLINGTTNLINDSQYSAQIEISSELSDSLDSTNFITNNPTTNNTDVLRWYSQEDASLEQETDFSGNELHGFHNSTPNYVSSKLTNGTGLFALDFNGNQWVELPHKTLLKSENNFSVALWFNTSTSPTEQMLISKRLSDTNISFQLSILASGKVQYEQDNGVTECKLESLSNVDNGLWHQVIITIREDPDQLEMFLDSISQGTNSCTGGDFRNIENITVGALHPDKTLLFTGQMDEIILFDEPLSLAQVTDLWINGLVNSLIPSNSIKVNFNITIEDGRYFLRHRKITTGMANLTIIKYLDNRSINTSNSITSLINTGTDATEITSLFNIGDNVSLRLFTDNIHNFSEIQLIESINDSFIPSVTDCQINNTILSCGDSIRLSCNATDDVQLDLVKFQWDDDFNNEEQADNILGTDIFFIDRNYGFQSFGIYNFTLANATDTAGKSNVTNLNLNYNYTCDTDGPSVALISPDDNNISNTSSIIFEIFAIDNLLLSNATLFHNLSGSFVSNETVSLTGVSDTGLFPITIDFNNTIIWNSLACDSLNNCRFASSNFTLTTNQTFPLVIPPIVAEINISLVSPDNNSILNFTVIDTQEASVDFTFNVSSTELLANCSLFINSSINITILTPSTGLNTISSSLTNGTYLWEIECQDFNGTLTRSEFRIVTITITSVIRQLFSVIQCPSTTGQALLLGLFIIIALFFITLGFISNIGFIGFFGAILLLITSLFVAPCINILALAMTLLSILLLFHFIFSGFFPKISTA